MSKQIYTYEGRIFLKSGGSSIPVKAEIDSPSPDKAKRLIEAQFAGRMKAWATNPHRTK